MSVSVIRRWFEGAAIQDRRQAGFTSTAHLTGAPYSEIDRSAGDVQCGVAAPFSDPARPRPGSLRRLSAKWASLSWRGDVDPHPQAPDCGVVVEGGPLSACSAQYERTDAADGAAVLGDRDEIQGGTDPRVGLRQR